MRITAKQVAVFLCCGMLASLPVTAQTSTGKFRYRPEKIVAGTVYHYIKTNIDGSHPEHIALYVAAPGRIESFKFHPGAERAGLVIAEMDWSIFSARRLESFQVFRGGEKRLFATLSYDGAGRAVEVSIPAMGKAGEKTSITHLPFHVYNFDLASLNFAFRHLINPRADFTVGVADPTFKNEGPAFQYRGEAHILYAGEETRNGVPCRKYKINGKGLEGRGGLIWVNQLGGHVEDMEIALPDNPEWQSFKLRLKQVQRMSRPEWETFMKSQF